MKLVNRCVLVLLILLWVGAAAVRAQQCTISPPPASGCTFQAFDAAAPPGSPELTAFCVGQPVRFSPCPERVIDPTLTRYGVRQGANMPFVNAAGQCAPPNAQPYIFTPQPSDVGEVTVSELSNDGANAFYYIRTYQVYATTAPTFTLTSCPDGFVLVTMTNVAYNSYTVQIGTFSQTYLRGQPIPPLSVPPGATSVSVTGRYAALASCPSLVSTQPIAPLAAPQTPLFTRITLQANGASTLDVGQLPAGYLYSLQIATPTGFRDVTSVPTGSTSFTPGPLDAGCYRLYRTDACGIRPVPSATTICTLSITGSSAQNRNRLQLTTGADPGTTYSVTRTPAATTPLGVSGGVVEDADVQCGTTYTYRVAATQPGGGVAVSNEVSIPTQSALQPRQPQLLASFNLNNVVVLTPLLAVPLTAGSTLRYRRAAGALPPADFRTLVTTARAQRDSTALAELLTLRPCYSVRLTDNCGIDSEESAATCPALLAAAALDADGTTTALTWTPYTGPGPSQAATYVLQRLAANGTVLSATPVSGNSFTDLSPPTEFQVLRYRLQISGAGLPGGTFSYSNVATVARRLTLAIPSAFTPNGDGLNDVLEVKGKYLRGYTFVVVDRNGQEVFRGTQRSDIWDGTIRGQAPVNGPYVWRFQQTDEEGKTFGAVGSVTILK